MVKIYNKRKWLNGSKSPSTGACVAYHGPASWDPLTVTSTFFEVSDCHCKARLHKTDLDSMEDFIAKLRKLAKSADSFANWLENNIGE